MNIVKLLQKNVKDLMRERGLTQVEVAKRGGISQGSVSIAVRGLHGQQLDIVYGLARGLGVTVSDLLSPAPRGMDADADRLLTLYSLLSPASRAQVLRVAESELRYLQSQEVK